MPEKFPLASGTLSLYVPANKHRTTVRRPPTHVPAPRQLASLRCRRNYVLARLRRTLFLAGAAGDIIAARHAARPDARRLPTPKPRTNSASPPNIVGFSFHSAARRLSQATAPEHAAGKNPPPPRRRRQSSAESSHEAQRRLERQLQEARRQGIRHPCPSKTARPGPKVESSPRLDRGHPHRSPSPPKPSGLTWTQAYEQPPAGQPHRRQPETSRSPGRRTSRRPGGSTAARTRLEARRRRDQRGRLPSPSISPASTRRSAPLRAASQTPGSGRSTADDHPPPPRTPTAPRRHHRRRRCGRVRLLPPTRAEQQRRALDRADHRRRRVGSERGSRSKASVLQHLDEDPTQAEHRHRAEYRIAVEYQDALDATLQLFAATSTPSTRALGLR